jgi:hypothetical protein
MAVAQQQQQLTASEIAKKVSASIARVVIYVILYVLVSAAVHYIMSTHYVYSVTELWHSGS